MDTLRNAMSVLAQRAMRPNKPEGRQTLELAEDPGNNWHENFIVHLGSVLKPRVYVELGLYHCELFNRMEPFVQRMIGVDLVPESGAYMIKNPKAEFKCMSTSDFAKELKSNPIAIDLLFIDADHSKEWVKQDFLGFFPFVSDQGVILVHDVYPKDKQFTELGYCGDGYQAIFELSKQKDEYEMMTIPVHPGLTLCRKRTTQLSWMERHD